MGRFERPGRARARRRLCAALDLGTNNCRLLVAEPIQDGFRVIDGFSRVVRLGQGLAHCDRLRDDAIDRALSAIKVCAAKVRRHRVEQVRAVATEACRQAINGYKFLERVAQETGLIFETIDAAEEARLAVRSCAPLLDPAIPHAIIFDIGGGSTEIMWVSVNADGQVALVDHISIPLGVVILSERYGCDRFSADAYRAMMDGFANTLVAFDLRYGISQAVDANTVQMVGTSGTVTTLASLNMHLPRYNRSLVDGSYLQITAARRVTEELLGLDHEGRVNNPCIGRDRADLVIPGCAAFDAICEQWPVQRLRVADRGLREGILLDLMSEQPSRRHGNGGRRHRSLSPAIGEPVLDAHLI